MIEYLTVNAMYVVLIVSLVIWLGLFLFLNRLDRKIRTLEDHMSKKG